MTTEVARPEKDAGSGERCGRLAVHLPARTQFPGDATRTLTFLSELSVYKWYHREINSKSENHEREV